MREDYSANGDAWNYFTHEHARCRAYRWGEDGLLGLCDSRGRLNFSVALWNGKDPYPQGAALRAERARGQPRRGRQRALLLPRRHADALVRACLYKYPQAEFPYERLREMARDAGDGRAVAAHPGHGRVRRRSLLRRRASSTRRPAPDDILVRITVDEPRPETRADRRAAAALVPQHVVVGTGRRAQRTSRELRAVYSPAARRPRHIEGTEPVPRQVRIWVDGANELLFTDNETNTRALFGTPEQDVRT